MPLKNVLVSLALTLAGSGAPAAAQRTLDDEKFAAADRHEPGAPSALLQSGSTDRLKPKVRRAATMQNELYSPIRKQDDTGQIPEIDMFVGESRVFPTPGVARIAVGNGQIMTASALDDKEVIIFANGAGTSSLFVWNGDGRYQRIKVNIVPGDTSRIAREVAAFLSAIPNAKASIVGDKVIVEGDALSDEDRDKIIELAKRYPQIVNFTSPIGWEQMVMMDVKVVEFPKTELRELGLKWTAAGGAAIGAVWGPIARGNDGPYQINIPSNGGELPITNRKIPGSLIPDGVTIPSALNLIGAMNLGIGAKLNLLEQSGQASILAEPQLSTRSGYKASFLAGGEFPYSVSSVHGVTIIFKPYGIKLDIEPKIGRNGVIRAVIESEVSSIDASITTASGPALLSRKTKTEFNVRDGETIVLSGLLQRNTSTDIDKLPLLGDIPILGALFRSKRFQNKETELVVFVTPTIVDSHAPGLADRVRRATDRLGEQLGKPPYLSDPLQPGRDAAKFNQASLAPAPGSILAPQSAPASAPASLSVSALGEPGPGGSSLRVTREALVIRAEPNSASPALLELGYHSIVQLGSADAQPPGAPRWRNVVAGAINGWVAAAGVEPFRAQAGPGSRSAVARRDQTGRMLSLGSAGAGAGAPAADPIKDGSTAGPHRRYRVVLQDLSLNVSPDTNALVLQHLNRGQVVQALPQAPRGNWMAVQANQRRGWVAAQWLAPE